MLPFKYSTRTAGVSRQAAPFRISAPQPQSPAIINKSSTRATPSYACSAASLPLLFAVPKRHLHQSSFTRLFANSPKFASQPAKKAVKPVANDDDLETDDNEDIDPKKLEQQQKELKTAEAEVAEAEKAGKVLPAAQLARALFDARKSGTFTTVTLDNESGNTTAPAAVPLYGSAMPYIQSLDHPGQAVVGIRRDERHYDNLQKSKRVSMAIFPLTPKEISPKDLPLPRVNMLGSAREITDSDEITKIIDRFEQVHPGSKKFLLEPDLFLFYELELSDVYLMKSSGTMSALNSIEYLRAKPDPIAPKSRGILDHFNRAYRAKFVELIKEYSGIDVTEVFMFEADRKGFTLMGKRQEEGWFEFRFPFDEDMPNELVFTDQLENVLSRLGPKGESKKASAWAPPPEFRAKKQTGGQKGSSQNDKDQQNLPHRPRKDAYIKDEDF